MLYIGLTVFVGECWVGPLGSYLHLWYNTITTMIINKSKMKRERAILTPIMTPSLVDEQCCVSLVCACPDTIII